MALIFLLQALDLLACIAWHSVAALLALPFMVLRLTGSSGDANTGDKKAHHVSCTYYEGIVTHIRRAPVKNQFRYPVRTALVSLDCPPDWFMSHQAADHMSAEQARQYAGTDGRVMLLTTPATAGYSQNPISVYYCYDAGGQLSRCIAEVTNTPWNERVTFVFDPQGANVKKALHVSPFMDMEGTWQLEAPEPGDKLRLVVKVKHPQYGDFFHADLVATKSQQPSVGSEAGSLGMLLRYGFQPHRTAVLIYWQALVLLWKGLPLYAPPQPEVPLKAASNASHLRDGMNGELFAWRLAPRWPWNAQPACPSQPVCPAMSWVPR